jgi:hypothetical protein
VNALTIEPQSAAPTKHEARNPKFETNFKFKCPMTKKRPFRFEDLNFGHWALPFDVAQGGESFDLAQDPEGLEGLVEPFRVSCFGFRILSSTTTEMNLETRGLVPYEDAI